MEETGGEMLNDGVVSTTTTLSPMSPSATIASPSIAVDSRNGKIQLPFETIVQRQHDANDNIETVVTPPLRESTLDVGGDENENDSEESEIIDTNNTSDRGSPRSILPRDMILIVSEYTIMTRMITSPIMKHTCMIFIMNRRQTARKI